MKRTALKRSTAKPRSRAISPASSAQRAKVTAEGKCRRCGLPESVIGLDPAHVTDRSIGGCDDALCVVPACRICHDGYDERRTDWLPILSRAEQAHAVSHLGIARAYQRTTGERISCGAAPAPAAVREDGRYLESRGSSRRENT